MSLVTMKRALVVEADLELKDLLTRVLIKEAWTLTNVASNKDAMKAVLEREYDLVTTSERTSAVEDVELLRKIRSVRPHTRLIILTRESTPSDVLDSMQAHAFSFFSVPYREDRLTEIIRYAVESPCWDDGIELISVSSEGIQIRASCQENTAIRSCSFSMK